MTTQIGPKYEQTLAKMSRYISGLLNGQPQENPEVVLARERGRCFYDRCGHPDKRGEMITAKVYREKEKVPSVIEPSKTITVDSRRTDYHFHESCIEELLKDHRLCNPN